MNKNLDKIMYWWAKLGSLFVVYYVLYAIYVGFYGIKTYFEIQEIRLEAAALGSYIPNFLSFGDLVITLLGLVFSIAFGLYIYSPFLYYGWVKNSNNKGMRSLTKTVTVLIPVIMLIGSIAYINEFSDVIPFLVVIFAMMPLYYYAWGR